MKVTSWIIRGIFPGDVKLPCNITIGRRLMRILNSEHDKLDYSGDFSGDVKVSLKNNYRDDF